MYILSRCNNSDENFSLFNKSNIVVNDNIYYSIGTIINTKIYNRGKEEKIDMIFIPPPLPKECFKHFKLKTKCVKHFNQEYCDDTKLFFQFVKNNNSDNLKWLFWYTNKDTLEKCQDICHVIFQSLVLQNYHHTKYFDLIYKIGVMCNYTFDDIKELITDFDINIKKHDFCWKNNGRKDLFEYISAKNGFNVYLIPRAHLHEIFNHVQCNLMKLRNNPFVLIERWNNFIKNNGIRYDFRESENKLQNAGKLAITHHTFPLFDGDMLIEVCETIHKYNGALCGNIITKYISFLSAVFIDGHPNVVILNNRDHLKIDSTISNTCVNHLNRRRLTYCMPNELVYIFSTKEIENITNVEIEKYSSLHSSQSSSKYVEINKTGLKKRATWFEHLMKKNHIVANAYVVMSDIEYETILNYVKTVYHYDIERNDVQYILSNHHLSDNYLHYDLLNCCEDMILNSFNRFSDRDQIKLPMIASHFWKDVKDILVSFENLELVDYGKTQTGKKLTLMIRKGQEKVENRQNGNYYNYQSKINDTKENKLTFNNGNENTRMVKKETENDEEEKPLIIDENQKDITDNVMKDEGVNSKKSEDGIIEAFILDKEEKSLDEITIVINNSSKNDSQPIKKRKENHINEPVAKRTRSKRE